MAPSSSALAIDTVDLTSPSATQELADSFARTGFVQLVGHGLDDTARAQHRAAHDQFFALDEEDKLRFVHSDPAGNRGYRRKGSEALSYSLGRPAPPDLFESFNTGATEDLVGTHRLFQPTPWPNAVIPEFQSVTERYISGIRSLVADLDRRIEELLGIDWLAARSTAGPDASVTINYRPNPDGTEPTVEGQQRMGAHSDYTTFTILDADPVDGLQILSPDGAWVGVRPEPGALLMNVGDLLAMFTNDRWPSTLHRVVPMDAGAEPNRRSVVYFHYPDLDVEVAPLDDFVTEAAHYTSVTVEDHLLDKLVAPKVHEASTGVNTDAGRLD